MTSSGKCHQCDSIAYKFHYIKPFRSGEGHHGYWHCADHGPIQIDTAGSMEDKPIPTPHLNRAERRKLLRKKK